MHSCSASRARTNRWVGWRVDSLLAQNDRDQGASVFECDKTVFRAARQMQKLARAHDLRSALGRELEASFQALNGDLARDLMGRDSLASRKNEAHDLELTGLEQCERLRRRHSASKQVDYLAWCCVGECHAASMQRGRHRR